MRLIDADELIKWIDDSVSQYGNTYSTDMLNMWGLFKDYLINNAPTVELKKEIVPVCKVTFDKEQLQEIVNKKVAEMIERPQGKCENCDFRKFTEKFVDGVVEVMTLHGITSVEELQARLQEEMRGKK